MNKTRMLPVYEQILWILVISAAGFLLGQLLYWLIKKIIKVSHAPVNKDFRRIKRPFVFLVLVLCVQLWKQFYFSSATPLFSHLAQIINIIGITWLLVASVQIGREYLLSKYKYDSTDNLKARKVYTQVRVFERIVTIVLLILAIGLILMTFESIREIGASILASAGVAGVILGIAAQRILANLLAGFQLAISQPIRLDDVVIVEGEWGKIEEITLTYVVVNIWDKRRLVVPSTYFIEKPFQNWTRSSSDLLGTVFLYTDYGIPIDSIRQELSRILSETDLWDGKVNVVQVTDATEKSMQVRLLVSAKDSGLGWDLRVHVREKMIDFLQREYPEHLPTSRVALKNS